MKYKEIKFDELKQDTMNFNQGSTEGMRLLDKSFTKFGAGRSILLDKDNNIIAGNKSAEIAERVGIKKVKVVESDGSKLIVIKRTDVSLDSRVGRELALADNSTALINQVWDVDMLGHVNDMCDGIDVEKWGLHLEKLDKKIESMGEIDLEEFEEELVLKLKYAPEVYNMVLEKLKAHGDNLAESVLQILNYDGEEI